MESLGDVLCLSVGSFLGGGAMILALILLLELLEALGPLVGAVAIEKPEI